MVTERGNLHNASLIARLGFFYLVFIVNINKTLKRITSYWKGVKHLPRSLGFSFAIRKKVENKSFKVTKEHTQKGGELFKKRH